ADAPQPDPEELRATRYSRGTVSWLTQADVPEDLRRRSFTTATTIGIDVDAEGRITGCRVLAPSSEPRLDRIACERARGVGEAVPVRIAPGRPVASRYTIAIGWQSIRPGLDTNGFYPPAPMAPPPPAPPAPSTRPGEPRLFWSGEVVAAALPPIQQLFPATARRAEGTVTLDLDYTAAEGIGGCTVAIPSGDAALDVAACEIARRLDLRYVEPCVDCRRSGVLPVQVVWRRSGGSHVRLPLIPSWSPPTAQQPRDPADTRTGHRLADFRAEAIRFTAADFAGVRDRTLRRPFLFVELQVGRDGRATACTLQGSSGNAAVDERICRLILRRTLPVRTDVFGDPAGGFQSIAVNLAAVGPTR
ncbi:MAG TPA: hypothetical protein VGB08_00035, partial [Allosphingosinicella sp.]